MTRWSAITRTRGRRSALAYGSRSTTATEDNLNRLIHHERGRYSLWAEWDPGAHSRDVPSGVGTVPPMLGDATASTSDRLLANVERVVFARSAT